MLLTELEHGIPEGKRPQSYVLDRFNVMCVLHQLQKLLHCHEYKKICLTAWLRRN